MALTELTGVTWTILFVPSTEPITAWEVSDAEMSTKCFNVGGSEEAFDFKYLTYSIGNWSGNKSVTVRWGVSDVSEAGDVFNQFSLGGEDLLSITLPTSVYVFSLGRKSSFCGDDHRQTPNQCVILNLSSLQFFSFLSVEKSIHFHAGVNHWYRMKI